MIYLSQAKQLPYIYTTAYALYGMCTLCMIKHHLTCLFRSHRTLWAHYLQLMKQFNTLLSYGTAQCQVASARELWLSNK